ncbi:Condensin complex subunit [Rhizophlyctis rosea]|nr:Condensin complex subunit [Rhizophlyctis rosea]
MADQFNLHEELMRLQNGEVSIEEEISIPDITSNDLEEILDELVETLQGDPNQIAQQKYFDTVRSFIKYFDTLGPEIAHKFVDLLLSVHSEQSASVKLDLEENAQHNFEQDRYTLYMYTFAWHWLVEQAEGKWRNVKKEQERAVGATTKPKGRGAKGKSQNANEWDWHKQRSHALTTAKKLLLLDLDRIIIASSERDMLINMITKSISLMLEDIDVVKDEALKQLVLTILCLCSTRYDRGLGHGVQTRVTKEYLREEHLSDFVAELLHMLVTQYNDTRLVENVLRDSADKVFTDKDTKLAKAYSRFFVVISELQPKEVLKQMVHLQVHLDSESHTIRIALLEVIGNLIHNFLATDNSDSAAKSMHAYYDILQERFRDVNSFVRVKVLQVLMKLTEAREGTAITDIPVATRPLLINLAAGRLHDKASIVRRNAIKLLTRFLETSPFLVFPQDKGSLSLRYFESKKRELEELIKSKFPTEMIPGIETEDSEPAEPQPTETGDAMDVDAMDVDDEPAAPQAEPEKQPPPQQPEQTPGEESASIEASVSVNQELARLRQFLKYYTDGIRFIRQIDSLVPTLCELLASNVKGEVVESMHFFVEAHRFQMECAKEGVKKMVHKIWEKDTGDSEVGSIREHLMKSYYAIYFEPLVDARTETAEGVADRLISLTHTMTLAELTSLEQLLSTMVSKGMVPDEVVETLWGIFASKKKEISTARRRGALTVLSYFAKAKRDVIADNLETLLRVGLGEFGKKDLLLARSTCIALQQLGATKRAKGSLAPSHARLPMTHPMFARLRDLILDAVPSLNWFGFAEQAINTIYLLSEHPDVLCGELIRRVAGAVFDIKSPTAQVDDVADQMASGLAIHGREGTPVPGETPPPSQPPQTQTPELTATPFDLSRLCFLVGHVAIKQMVHLEVIESEWKRRKHSEMAEKTPRKAAAAVDELDAVTGTAEDEFTEAIAHVRENELLYGEGSLLNSFGSMVAFVCSSNRTFKDPILQNMAVLSLCKLMCVSSEFCESHLQLLFTILEKSTSPIIRSNTIIGLGDMTVSFNTLIDQNISYLYARLSDPDPNVQKNTLMVLTFLILNGMVKVKGQLSEMAKCLESEDRRIGDLARLFFRELSGKDNAVYNNLPDIISGLSGGGVGGGVGVEEEAFRSIMKYLLEFIKKERQTENIVDKLCLRFRNAETPRQWRDISYCLSLLNVTSEKSVRKVVEHLPSYQDKLGEGVVYKQFCDIMSKAKKLAKADLKQFIEEFEAKLAQLHEKGVENDAAVSAARDVQGKVKGGRVKRESGGGVSAGSSPEGGRRRQGSKKNVAVAQEDMMDVDDLVGGSGGGGAKTPAAGRAKKGGGGKTPGRGRGRRVQDLDEEEAEDEEEEVAVAENEDVEMEEAPVVAKTPRRSGRSVNQGRGRKVVESEEEEEEEEEDNDDGDEEDEDDVPRKGTKGGMVGVPRWKAALQKAGRTVREVDEDEEDDEGGDDDGEEEDSDEEEDEEEELQMLQSPRKGPVRKGVGVAPSPVAKRATGRAGGGGGRSRVR